MGNTTSNSDSKNYTEVQKIKDILNTNTETFTSHGGDQTSEEKYTESNNKLPYYNEYMATKAQYLLTKLKSLMPGKKLSVTIRLHQVKYFQRTGVPPADCGMLMFYNIGSLESINTTNSIFSTDAAKQYLANFDKYPMHLDVVLPAFSWGVVFRNNRFAGIINDLDKLKIASSEKFKEIAPGRFECFSETIISSFRFKVKDIIRLEITDPGVTLTSARLIADKLKGNRLTVALYNLNKELIKKYDTENINNIIDCFN